MSSRPATPVRLAPVVVEESITIAEITNQILINAEILFPPNQDLKVVTSMVPSGLMHHAALMASDAKSASAHKEYSVLLTGSGEKNRRESLLKLLEDTERRVSKQILKK